MYLHLDTFAIHFRHRPALFPIFRCRPERYAATRGEFAPHGQPGWRQQLHQVVADPVDARFMKLAMHAEGAQVELQALTFDAELIRLVVNDDFGEVGLAGQGAEGGEFRALNMDRADGAHRIALWQAEGVGK